MQLERPTLVNTRGFLKAARDAGLTTLDAISELVDNSLDAGANNIEISIQKNGPYLRMVVIDDGVGIPEAIEADGKTYDGIAYALSFGGRAPSDVPGVPIGKFGAGLTNAACCQSLRTDVYSKVLGEKQTRYNTLDLEALEATGDLHLPVRTHKEPPKDLCPDWSERPSGTIVSLEKCDRPDRKQENKMEELVTRHLSMVYRRFLIAGRRITVNSTDLVAYDPLFATAGGWDTYDPDAYQPASPEEPDSVPLVKRHGPEPGSIVFDDVVEFPEFPDETGDPHRVSIKIAWLDVRRIRSHKKWSGKWMERHGLNEEHQGFYLMRNDRQIGAAESFGPHGLFVRNADYNYFRGEISFPPELDKIFGIQHNKGRFSVKENVKDKFATLLKPVLSHIRQETRRIIRDMENERKAREQETAGPSPAEKAMKKVARTLKAPRRTRTRADSEGTAEEGPRDEVTDIKQRIEEVRNNPQMNEDEKEKQLTVLEAAAERAKLPFTIRAELIADGCFFHIRRMDKQAIVVLNSGHEFYGLYQEAYADPRHRALLEVLLMSAAHGEAQFEAPENPGEQSVLEDIEAFRREWSIALNVVLRKMRDEQAALAPDTLELPA